jgi:hypothetical protein
LSSLAITSDGKKSVRPIMAANDRTLRERYVPSTLRRFRALDTPSRFQNNRDVHRRERGAGMMMELTCRPRRYTILPDAHAEKNAPSGKP